MKRNLVLFFAVIVCLCAYGQGEIDAYRMSKNDLSGTARGQAMGGAFGALGGDPTGVSINPAGIAVYRSSEVVLNAGLSFNTTNSNWDGLKTKDSKTSFTADNVAYIGTYTLDTERNRRLNFGFTFNRLKNFDRRYRAGIGRMNSSLTDFIASKASQDIDYGGYRPNEWLSSENFNYYDTDQRWLNALGWYGYLIDPNANNDGYVSRIPNVAPSTELTFREKGNISSYDFTLGYSSQDYFYLGATIALTNISYSMESTYMEDFGAQKFYLDNTYIAEGTGVQMKLGTIWRPTDILRLGLSFHTPTWYLMKDYYRGSVDPYGITYEDKGITYDAERVSTPRDARTAYSFSTPSTLTASVALVAGKNAIISVDYELKNYGGAKFADEDGYIDAWYEDNSNKYIKEDLRNASSVRIGAEYRFTPRFSVRAGYAWMQQPYSKDIKDGKINVITEGTAPHYSLEGAINHLTAGLGYRFTPNFYIDLAYVYRTQKDKLYPFPSTYDEVTSTTVTSTPATVSVNNSKVLMTVGYKF
ncbi:MAG: outer membrane protein transport protein [Dysgonamonadaceae bacterium]|nr:outer membrane protein transport protein [Dysgonamonadaceae bacterium]